MNLSTKHKQTHRLGEWTYGYRGEGWGEEIVREFRMDMYTLLYLKWIINKYLLYSTGNSAQDYPAARMGAGLGRELIHVLYMTESLCCLPETVAKLLIGCTPIQHEELKKISCERLYSFGLILLVYLWFYFQAPNSKYLRFETATFTEVLN